MLERVVCLAHSACLKKEISNGVVLRERGGRGGGVQMALRGVKGAVRGGIKGGGGEEWRYPSWL